MSWKAESTAEEGKEQSSSAYSDLVYFTSLCGEISGCIIFYFSPYSFLGCDVKDMMKCQAQISLTNPVSIYTDNHSSLH